MAPRAFAREQLPPPTAKNGYSSVPLLQGWEHRRGTLGSVWDVWREDHDNGIKWQPVPIPHCFNARDAVDPDGTFYEGPAWYRIQLEIANPFQNGRTMLHFEGAGQKSEVFVFLDKAGQHLGGYDEFAIDISESSARALKAPLQADGFRSQYSATTLATARQFLPASTISIAMEACIGGLISFTFRWSLSNGFTSTSNCNQNGKPGQWSKLASTTPTH